MSEVEARLRELPSVHELAAAVDGAAPRWAAVEAARRLVAERRKAILAGAEIGGAVTVVEVERLAVALAGPHLRRVVNATGVVLHTNLGRAPLAPPAIDAVVEAARGYTNLEYDLARGERGSRHAHAEELVRAVTGAEAACVVNNNAAACVLALGALAGGREVIVSRGELIEIGGSFRIPDIMRMSGAILVEVGTTNKTRRADYEAAIGERTAMVMKVHRSNFAMVGFTEEVGEAELAALARARGIASMVDLGSGCLVARDRLRELGLPEEPPVAEVVAAGVDLVCFSGDKLLGGPQAGVLVGRADAIERVRKHPLMRAMRPDKLTVAALCATLALYRDGREDEIPTWAMLGADGDALKVRAMVLAEAVKSGMSGTAVKIEVEPCRSTVGGGAMPMAALSSWAVTLGGGGGGDADAIDARLRGAAVPVIARVEDGKVWLDLRTIAADDHDAIVAAVALA